MIDILGPVTAAAHGGCVECNPHDARGNDLYVFRLGTFTIRLCRHHLALLERGLAKVKAPHKAPHTELATRSPAPR